MNRLDISRQQVDQFFEDHGTKAWEYKPLPDGNPSMQLQWILHQSHCPYLKLMDLDIPYKDMLAEAQGLKSKFVSHRSEHDDHLGWKSLAIHGISSEKTNTAQAYGLDPNEVSYDWTDIQDQCPITVSYFKTLFPYIHYQRLRFMLVEPGGFITPHSDSPRPYLGSAINISLNNPPGCTMMTTEGPVPFEDDGTVLFFNNYYQHAVWNRSDTDRFHIIVHGSMNVHKMTSLIVNSYKIAMKADGMTVF